MYPRIHVSSFPIWISCLDFLFGSAVWISSWVSALHSFVFWKQGLHQLWIHLGCHHALNGRRFHPVFLSLPPAPGPAVPAAPAAPGPQQRRPRQHRAPGSSWNKHGKEGGGGEGRCEGRESHHPARACRGPACRVRQTSRAAPRHAAPRCAPPRWATVRFLPVPAGPPWAVGPGSPQSR